MVNDKSFQSEFGGRWDERLKFWTEEVKTKVKKMRERFSP